MLKTEGRALLQHLVEAIRRQAAIVADLAALHGGRLVLHTSPLGGLSARVWLPAQPLAAMPARMD